MNRPGKRVSAEKGKLTRSGENFNKIPDKARVDKAEKNKQLTVDETVFFDSLSARFSWPYVPNSTAIIHCASDENDRPSEQTKIFKLTSVYVPVYISEFTRT